MNREQFRTRFTEKPLLLDGAMGTVLHAKGYRQDQCFDILNLNEPAAVADVHRAYIAAGVDIIETNTFGANRYRLGEFRLQKKVHEINLAAANIAKRVIDGSFKDVLLAGSIGPLGSRLAPLGRITTVDAQDAFFEQASALVEGGVDLIVIETMSDIFEVAEAIKAVRRASPEMPIVTMLTFTRDDRTLLGNSSADIATRLSKLDIDVIGANCSGGPAQMLRLVATMKHVAPNLLIAASPNAGWPEHNEGRVMYPATPTYFADYARAFCEAGVNLIGGCCGTTDAHIAAMRIALDSPAPSHIKQPRIQILETDENEAIPADPPTDLAMALEAKSKIVTIEMRPPKGIAAQKMLAGAQTLKQAGATFLNVADIPLARMRMSAWAAAYLIQDKLNVETILHFPTRGRNLLRVQADLLAAHAMGVRNLFVTMGDPTRIGDYPEAMDSYDIVSTGLIKLIKDQLNAGMDKAGAKLDQPTNFVVGCAASLNPRSFEKEAKLLNKKIRFGADFGLTQPVFDPEQAQTFIDFYENEYGKLTLPLIIGVQPLYNSRNAEFLHNEVPGITIPQTYRDRMRNATDRQAEGVKISREIIEQSKGFYSGVYVIPAFGRYDLAADVIDGL